MMKQARFLALLPLLMAFSFPVITQADEITYETSALFKFQQKLALKNNVNAQYKLGSMYEVGEGVRQDLAQAEYWYGLAQKAGKKAAKDRITYLTIKKQGYDPKKYSSWLASIKEDANNNKGEAKFLLAQLYHEGIGVKKDLAKSLQLFQQVSLLGDANVDGEMALIRDEIEASKRAELKAARVEPVVKAPVKAPVKPAVTKEQQMALQAAAEKNKMAEKRKRYEAVMQKIKLEQKMIDDQQADVSGTSKGLEDEI